MLLSKMRRRTRERQGRSSAGRKLFLALATMAFGASAHAQETPIGVNVIDPYGLSTAAQDQMLDDIHAAGAPVIRASLTLDDKGVAFAERVRQHGIRVEWLIYRFGNYDPFGKTPLSAADPAQFRTTFEPVLKQLEDKGIVLAGFELGNEINLSGTNPEFKPHPGRAKQLSLAELESDPEGQAVARGFVQYLKVLSVLKDIRDHSRLNQHTPIMTAGLGTYDQADGPLPSWAKGDVVSIDTSLRFMRQHGLDTLVDAYAVHIYPDTKSSGAAGAALRKDHIGRYDLGQCAAKGSPDGKPCWITEWGVDNTDVACPIDDRARAQMMTEIMGDFRHYSQDGRLAGVIYFAWNTAPTAQTAMASSLWRCGGLAPGGKVAVNPNLLK